MKKVRLFLMMMVVATVSLVTSCTTVDPGYEGFYSYYSEGVDTVVTEKDGTHWHSPWTTIIQMNVQQQDVKYNDVSLKDVDQVKMTVDYSVAIQAEKGSTPKLYLLHGENYINGFVDAKAQGAVKDVIGKYSYVDILGKDRDKVEEEIEAILRSEFEGNYILCKYVEIKDIQLPASIQDAITAKEAQEQNNLLAQKKQQEQIYLADAKIAKAKGDSTALIINSSAQAEEIKIKSQMLQSSPEYIELIKWQGYAQGKGSPYGDNNVFGAGTGVVKGLK